MTVKDYIKQQYIDFVAASGLNNKKKFNHFLKNSKCVKAHPYKDPNSGTDILLIGFSDDTTVKELDSGEYFDNVREIFHTIKSGSMEHVEGCKVIRDIDKTVIISCSEIVPFELPFVSWDDVMKLPVISSDVPLRILESIFLKMHRIDDCDFEEKMHYESFWYRDNPTIPGLEFRKVWCDVNRQNGYGKESVLILWQGEFIATAYWDGKTCNGSYFSVMNEYKWIQFMKFAKKHIELVIGTYEPEMGKPYTVIDPLQSADNYIGVVGVSDIEYNIT